jgi:hypothetical protein
MSLNQISSTKPTADRLDIACRTLEAEYLNVDDISVDALTVTDYKTSRTGALYTNKVLVSDGLGNLDLDFPPSFIETKYAQKTFSGIPSQPMDLTSSVHNVNFNLDSSNIDRGVLNVTAAGSTILKAGLYRVDMNISVFNPVAAICQIKVYPSSEGTTSKYWASASMQGVINGTPYSEATNLTLSFLKYYNINDPEGITVQAFNRSGTIISLIQASMVITSVDQLAIV